MKTIRLSRAAVSDRDAIDDYTTEQFGMEQAIRTRASFRDAFEQILTFPQAGQSVPDLSPPGRELRARIVLGVFAVVYEIVEQEIRVARILHVARDLPSELRREYGIDYDD